MTRSRSGLGAVALGLLVSPLALLVAPADATSDAERPAGPRPMHGEQAVDALGADLDSAAALVDMAPDRLRTILATDPTAWLDADQRLYYVEPAAAPAAGAPTSVALSENPAVAAAPPAFHSRPGSLKTIFLDFNGATVANTSWNDNYGVGTSHPAYSLDGNSGTFNAAEKAAIRSIWERVSEDYAPFDVDVTTQDPGAAAIDRTNAADQTFGTRALISPSADAAAKICNSACGGVAYVDVFDVVAPNHSYVQPAWIFPQLLGGNDTKDIAEAASHEVGHNLGLSHDGTSTVGYYQGHSVWAPIMGVGYGRPVVQWSKGEYADANNHEDDLAIIASNGPAVIPDDAGNTVGAAAAFTTARRIIATGADKDVYSLGSCAGTIQVTASPAATSPDLDIKLDLLRANGTVIVANNPPAGTVDRDVASGLGATVSASVTGPVYARVDGINYLNGANGFTNYASLGAYTLTRSCT